MPVIYVVRGRPGQNDRPALSAGHPISWELLTAGTVIDGAKYPHPVYLNDELQLRKLDQDGQKAEA